MRLILSYSIILLCITGSLTAQQKWEEKTVVDQVRLVDNKGGQTIGYSSTSGLKLITRDGLAFKDLNRNGELDVYEDWRQPFEIRAKDLASRMTVEQIAGLMLYSGHQAVPAGYRGFGPPPTYNGKPYPESGAKPSDLTDQQKKFLTNDNLRHVLITTVESPEVAARWNNNMQALVEGIGLGIPANTSTDPRHNAQITAEFNAGSGGKISLWPESLGLAATFNPALVRKFGEIAAKEYRALGIATALSPQIDLATDPRWNRF
ncbi:MAG TPA: glycoside hydrolase family 3 N-terminal domain-containing protein, partial [Chitinophagaceae bacterium]|nr:glycoside hydrolase family 3 N-terminal domain-containing protein [Chitinophagaceae bacterium]